jgi:integrase
MASLVKRNGTYYLQWYVGRKIRRRSLRTKTLQIAKEKLRQFESAQHRGIDDSLPTRTPISEVITAYVEHIRQVKTPKSAQTDIYYLREAFGPICDALQITSRRVTEASRKRPRKPGQDRRCRPPRIEADCFEAITTTDVATLIRAHTLSRGLAPKTANRYREIIVRLFNWGTSQLGIRMPGGRNPAAAVERYKEPAPEIRYLTLEQIDEQLAALEDKPQLQTMVAVLIYAGLRREELLWLQRKDVSLQRGLIYVRAKTAAGRNWQPKTRKNRGVPISDTLRRFLDRYSPRPSRGEWYFPSPVGEWWDPDNFSSTMRVVNAHHGLRWTCLHFRHTFGSQLAQKGVSLYKISHLLGNSPPICSRHYASLIPASMHADVSFTRLRTAL